MVKNMWNELMYQVMDNIQLKVEFLDHVFSIEVPTNVNLLELHEIIEKFILENPSISIDLKSLSKTLLDTEYYNIVLKQRHGEGEFVIISEMDQIFHKIPIRVELETDENKKRYYTKKHLKSTFRHIESISIPEFTKVLKIKNINSLRQKLLLLESQYPYSIKDDIIFLNEPFSKPELRSFSNQLLAT